MAYLSRSGRYQLRLVPPSSATTVEDGQQRFGADAAEDSRRRGGRHLLRTLVRYGDPSASITRWRTSFCWRVASRAERWMMSLA